jgi:undecaprenyl-diphosphatase
MVCVVFFRRWGWLLFLPAVLVSYSRVYVGSHWPLDVLVSGLLGVGVGLLTVVAVEASWRRWGGVWVPGLHTRHPSLLTA